MSIIKQGEPVELVNCETVDIPVPAQAEIVLEGRIELDEEDEGPFTEYTGYISGRSTRNLFKVSAVTMRKDAYFVAVAPSNSAEHLLLSGLPKQARISRAIIDYTHTPALKDIIWPVWATHFVCFISINGKKRQIKLSNYLSYYWELFFQIIRCRRSVSLVLFVCKMTKGRRL